MFLKTSRLSWFNWHTTWSVLCKCHHITTLTRLSFHEAFRTVLNIIWCTHRAESIRTAGADALSRVVHIFTTDLVRRLTANSRAWICFEKVLQGSCRKFNGFNFFTSRNERKLISSYKIVNYLVKGEKSKSKKKGIEVLSFEWLSIYGRHLCKLRINEWLWLEKLTCIAKIQNVDRGENW